MWTSEDTEEESPAPGSNTVAGSASNSSSVAPPQQQPQPIPPSSTQQPTREPINDPSPAPTSTTQPVARTSPGEVNFNQPVLEEDDYLEKDIEGGKSSLLDPEMAAARKQKARERAKLAKELGEQDADEGADARDSGIIGNFMVTIWRNKKRRALLLACLLLGFAAAVFFTGALLFILPNGALPAIFLMALGFIFALPGGN